MIKLKKKSRKKSLTEKLKELFFKSHEKDASPEIYKGVWKAQEGSKWLYFKERSDEPPKQKEPSTGELTAAKYAERVITRKFSKDIIDKAKKIESSSGSSAPSDTFSVTEFVKKHGHRGGPPENEAQKEKSDEKKSSHEKSDEKTDLTPTGKLEIDKAIKHYTKNLLLDPYNMEVRKKVINLYLEKNDYYHALKVCYEMICSSIDNESNIVFSGNIRYISPFYIFQIFINNKQSGKISFFLAGEEASIYFLQGKGVHAKDRWGKGEEVIKRILSWREGIFNFVPDDMPIELSLDRSLEKILEQSVGTPMKTEKLRLGKG